MYIQKHSTILPISNIILQDMLAKRAIEVIGVIWDLSEPMASPVLKESAD